MAINVIVVVGLNLLVGYTGQISMGHAGFFAIGAYGTIVLMTKAHFPFLLALPCAGLGGGLFGFLLGLPALRLEGPYLAIATLGFGITATQIIGKIKIFGERQGLHAPELTIGPWHIETDKDFYFVLIPSLSSWFYRPQYRQNKGRPGLYPSGMQTSPRKPWGST
jgi:branched-chain amino acid transport system permease protein